jgi:chromosome segregation ATPase
MSRASTLLNDDSGGMAAARGRNGRIQVPDVMLGSTDSFDATAMSGGAATARSERHLQRELADLKQQFQFAAVQHREDVNILRSKLMEMQHQLSQAVSARDEAFEAIVNERAVASLRVQESEAAHRDAAKAAQQLREKLQLEEQRGRDLMRALDGAQKDVEDRKQQLKSLEQQQQLNLQKLQLHDKQQLDAKHRAIAAEEAHQQLQQQLQHQHEQHQQQMDSLQSQLQQQLRAAQSEASAAQISLIDSERHRSNAEARANRYAVFIVVCFLH